MTSPAKAAIKKTLIPVTITLGQTVSPEIDLRNMTPVGVIAPADWDSTTITFQVAEKVGGTYVALEDGNGNTYSRTLGASKGIPLDPTVFCAWDAMKIVAGTTVAGTDTVLQLLCRPI